jgi:hypothetical protein
MSTLSTYEICCMMRRKHINNADLVQRMKVDAELLAKLTPEEWITLDEALLTYQAESARSMAGYKDATCPDLISLIHAAMEADSTLKKLAKKLCGCDKLIQLISMAPMDEQIRQRMEMARRQARRLYAEALEKKREAEKARAVDEAEELKWVVDSLFVVTEEKGGHIRAKGEDGFFLTIKNCTDERVQRAWQLSCSGDGERIARALAPGNAKHSQLPQEFVKRWEDATIAVFGRKFKFKDRTQGKRKEEGQGFPDIKCLHVFKLGRKRPRSE